jgi:hypothetical protein
MMDIQVRISLQGGHVWEFCCDEDDPIVVGLVSALPGAEAGGNLPPDGLIQVEAKTGERLFLTRSSLVSVELIPIVDDMQFRGVRRLTAPSGRLPGARSNPSPFVLVPEMLPRELHRALIEHVLAPGEQTQSVPPPDGAADDLRELRFAPLERVLAKAFEFHLSNNRAVLGAADSAETHLHCRLLAVGNAGAVTLAPASADLLHFVYHFHKAPRAFTGGGMRLFDSRIENGLQRAADAFRDVIIDDNSLLIFPSHVVSAGLPVRSTSRTYADGLFVVCGALRRGPAGG